MLLRGWLVKDLSISKLKFLADEDLDARLVRALCDKGVDVVFASKGIRNSELYSVACKEGKALLSLDKDFLNSSLFPPSKLPAIVIMRVHPPKVSKLESLFLKWLEKFSDDMKGKTWVITDEGFSIAD